MNDTTLTLIDLLVKGTAVLLLGFGCIAMLRHSSAAHRSLAWLAAFVVMLALPLAAPVKPVWTVPVHVVSKQNVMTPKPAAPAPFIRTNELPPVIAPIHPSTPWTLWHWLAGVYAIGACSVIGFRLLGSWQLLRLRRNASAADAEIVALVQQLSPDHRILILESSDISVPMTWGTFKPLLLLPTSVRQWSTADLRAALEHELAHIRHRDAARRWLGTLVSALWWPHPLVWIASKAWKLEQERACDDAVVRSGANTERYATQLIEAAHSIRLSGFQSAAALVMAMPSGLETRLRAVVGESVNRSSPGRGAHGWMTLSSLTLIVGCASCQIGTLQDSSAKGMIRVRTTFIEMTARSEAPKLPGTAGSVKTGDARLLPIKDGETLLRQLTHKKGTDVISGPELLFTSGGRSSFELVRMFTDIPAGKEVAPSSRKFPHVGATMTVKAVIGRDHSIHLDLAALVREFEGFKHSGNPFVAESSAAEASLPLLLPESAIPTPVFSERHWKHRATLHEGQMLVGAMFERGPDNTAFDLADTYRRRLWVIISANVVGAEVQSSPPSVTSVYLFPHPQRPNAMQPDAMRWLQRLGVVFHDGDFATFEADKARLTVKTTPAEKVKVDAILTTPTPRT